APGPSIEQSRIRTPANGPVLVRSWPLGPASLTAGNGSPLKPHPMDRAPRRLGYLPWMDGMRAVGVLAVMVFHESLAQPKLGIQKHITGGALGVDVFFAISGFLITALLLQEAAGNGAVNLARFYARRARRLLPALAAVLVALAVGAVIGDNAGQRGRLLEHALFALVYVANWVIALGHANLGVLNHTWSLSAEEQFYLVWPVTLIALLALTRGRRWWLVGIVALIMAAACAWPAIATRSGYPYERIYYGLDTRCASIAIGALLGVLWAHDLLPKGKIVAVARRLLAVASAVVLILAIRSVYVLTGAGHLLGWKQSQSAIDVF